MSEPRDPAVRRGPDGSGADGPPPGAIRLAGWRLPEEVADAVVGDLEEAYRSRVRPEHGRFRADLWFWWQAVTVRRGALRRAAGRLRATRPTWERNRPHRAALDPDPWSRIVPLRDVTYALRRLTRSPGFTAVAILSLALGIGANTAMFSVVNAVLLRGTPAAEPHRMVEVYTSEADGFAYSTTSHPDYVDLRGGTEVFESVVATRSAIARVERDGRAEVAMGELVSWDYFQTLGLDMALGRPFLEEEDRTPGTHPVVVLGHRFWTDRYGADPDVLGRTLHLNGRPFTVVGVAPEAYRSNFSVLVSSFFTPHMMTNEVMAGSDLDQLGRRGSRSLFVKARLRPGVAVAQADAAVEALSRGLAEEYPDTNTERIMSVLPSSDVAVHPLVDRALVPVAGLLLGVVGLVLLIACANLASFLLARAEDRRKEIAIRLALGAGRTALVRQLLVETVLLASLGGAVGVLVAGWTLDLVMAFQPPIPVPLALDIGLDGTVLAFTAGVSLLAGLAFGLAPALQATDPDVAPTLKNEGIGAGRSGRPRLRNALVVSQVAFSFVLLIGAGLFVRSLQKAQAIDPGFYTGPAALVWPMPELSGYETREEQGQLMRLLEEGFQAHPLIDQVARTDRVPLGAAIQTERYLLPGVPSNKPDGDHDIDNTVVAPGYFETMEVDIVRGRAFADTDRLGEPVAIVSEAFVQRYYPGRDVLGMTLGRPGRDGGYRIVGVARDTKVRTLGEEPRPYVYVASREGFVVDMQFVVRGRASAPELLAAAREVIDAVDPDLVLLEAKTMNEHLAIMLFAPRMAALLLSVFGGLALALSAIGIYGVVSYAVSRRTRELGIRMSLGATARDVVVMAVGGGMRLVAVGGAIGVVLAGGVTWALARFLYGISSTDVLTFVVIPVLLTGVALLAAFVPARRASAVDPVRALRSE